MSRNFRAIDTAANKRNNRQELLSQRLERHEQLSLNRSIDAAREELLNRQTEQGYWLFELEADCTIPAEYIMMMHYLDEIDPSLEAKIAVYLRAHQADHGGWPLYYGGELNISCTVKAYYALKLAGDSPDAPHMVRARKAILERGGAARANVFTRIALALFGQCPWRAVPYIPVEIMLMPRWFPFHLDKVSYWSRTVMVPLFILCTYKPKAKNPRNVHIPELFTVPAERERSYFRLGPERSGTKARVLATAFLLVDRTFRVMDFLIPRAMRTAATKRAETWFLERLNGEDGLGAIFPAMVNALEAMVLLGYPSDDPRRVTAKKALENLLVIDGNAAYCQPCVSPIWDTALATLAVQESGGAAATVATHAGLEWLRSKQLLNEPGDWQVSRPDLKSGGWPFQFANGHYPDLDDTAAIVWAMHRAGDHAKYTESMDRALDWLRGMQSSDGGFAAFDVDNTHYNLNQIPFADHGALLDPPTADVTARVVAAMAIVGRPQDQVALQRAIDFLRRDQTAEGSWFGRWGTNHIYGTWSVLAGLGQAGIGADDEAVRRAVDWLNSRQNSDGGWGESNDSYAGKTHLGERTASTPHQTAWALLGLMAAGQAASVAARCGIEYLLRTQQADGLWSDPHFTAPGFPRVFYLKYHGYCAYFPLWALSAYRNLVRPGAAHWH
ncbi:MAG: squalene-hopene/tetraprenyl-beta-curcumene cyclase [Gammaproteobacteria bacterium]|nr:squalene-hopene/tetraprenyl-beta-curcumene cyclase [Gammaproteobacteria bacterium]